MAREPDPQAPDFLPSPWPGLTTDPAFRFGLDLDPVDDFAGSLGQAEGLGGGPGEAGHTSQHSWGHLLLGAVGEETRPLLGQGAVLVASQRMRLPEELVEHRRASKRSAETLAIQP